MVRPQQHRDTRRTTRELYLPLTPTRAEIPGRFAAQLRAGLDRFRRLGRFRRSPEAEEHWAQIYVDLDTQHNSPVVDAITARAEAQLLRLSVAYAGLDGTDVIDVRHQDAALALWRYCAASAEYIFGTALGDPQADHLLGALRAASSRSLDGTEQQDLFGRHLPGRRLKEIRQQLEAAGLARTVEEQTGGRPRVVTYLVEPAIEAI
jgi:hypothetical protein